MFSQPWHGSSPFSGVQCSQTCCSVCSKMGWSGCNWSTAASFCGNARVPHGSTATWDGRGRPRSVRGSMSSSQGGLDTSFSGDSPSCPHLWRLAVPHGAVSVPEALSAGPELPGVLQEQRDPPGQWNEHRSSAPTLPGRSWFLWHALGGHSPNTAWLGSGSVRRDSPEEQLHQRQQRHTVLNRCGSEALQAPSSARAEPFACLVF